MSKTRPPLSLAHLTVLDAGPLELIDAARAAGFDAVGLRIVAPPAAPPVAEVIGTPEMIRSIERHLRETGLSILDVEAVWLLPHTDPADFAAIVETGARLGARFVLAVGNDPEPQRQLDNFARLAESAHTVGLRAMLEFMPFSQVKTLADARRLVAQAGVPGAGFLLDALHLWRSGGDVADLATLGEGELGYVQLCDARAEAPPAHLLRDEARTDRLYPGAGSLDLVGLLQALPQDMPLSVEAPSAAHAGLPVGERARLCAEETRRLLARATRASVPAP